MAKEQGAFTMGKRKAVKETLKIRAWPALRYLKRGIESKPEKAPFQTKSHEFFI